MSRPIHAAGSGASVIIKYIKLEKKLYLGSLDHNAEESTKQEQTTAAG